MKHIKIIVLFREWHERTKNLGTKLPAPLKKGFYKAKKKPNLSSGPKPTVIRRHESLKNSKVFTFYKKTGPDRNRTSGICLLKHGNYHCLKCTKRSLNLIRELFPKIVNEQLEEI